MKNTFPSLAALVNYLPPHRRGWLAELWALLVMVCKGYWPVRRPGRAPVQTDLLLRRGKVLVLVEVKYRQTAQQAALAISPAQQQRLKREAARLSGYFPNLTCRLDVVYIFPHWPTWRHVSNALPLD